MSHYEAYYRDQAGGGGRGVHNVFIGSNGQRGHGIGSWLAGLFRSAVPLLAKGARAVGKEALRAGVNILDDVTENRSSFKNSLQNRINESGKNLKRKAVDKINTLMEGSGYKRVANKRNAQYPWSASNVRIGSVKNRTKSKRRKTATRRKSVKRLKPKSKKRKTQKKKKNQKKKAKKRVRKVSDIFG